MLIFSISRKKAAKTLMIVFTILVVLGLVLCIFNQSAGKSKSEKSTADEYVTSIKSTASSQEKVEIFDITAGKVVRELPVEAAVRDEAVAFLKNLTGVYVKVKAFPDKGKIVKIPMLPAVKVKSKYLDSIVHDVYVLYPEEGSPYLMVLDEKNRPLFFNFKGDTKRLGELVGLDQTQGESLPEPAFYTPESRL